MKPGTPGFIGARLREAREARSITAASLAELIGVTRAAVSQYEQGRQSPSPLVFARIAECLNVPSHFFLTQRAPDQAGTIFYRCMSAATKKARLRAERRYAWLREIVAFLRQYVRFPAVSLPEFKLPLDPARMHEEDMEEFATETRRTWGLGAGPISNVTWLLENHGAVVSRFDLGAATLDAFSEWNRSEATPYIILGSAKHSAVRSRYDAAHELAHMILHRHVPRGTVQHPDSFTFIERQAHRFAAAFLLPAPTFSRDLYSPSLDRLRALKEKWGVSIGAMVRRAAQLSLITESHERTLWINLGRRKWRTREPLDDILKPEEPRFLYRAMQLLIAKGIVAPNELPLRLALAAHDIEELTGLESGYLRRADPDIALIGDDKREEEGQIIPFPDRQ